MNEKLKLNDADLGLLAVLKTPEGRALLASLLRKIGYFSDNFDADTTKHAYNSGRRSVGVTLVNWIKRLDPDQFLNLIKEDIRNEY